MDPGQSPTRSELESHDPGIIGMPVVEWMYTKAALSLVNLFHYVPRGSGLRAAEGKSTIAGKRNDLARLLLDSEGMEWLFFADSDQAYHADTVARLLRHERADLVTGVVFERSVNHKANVAWIEELENSGDPLRPTDVAEIRTRHLPANEADGTLYEPDLCGAGCLLIRRPVFEAMDPPWFVANQDRLDQHGQSEDWNFVLRATRGHGFRLVCDSSVQPVHLTMQGITRTYAAVTEQLGAGWDEPAGWHFTDNSGGGA